MMLTLHDPQQSHAFYKNGSWQSDTFFSLLEKHAVSHPDKVALRDNLVALTWAELLQEVERVAMTLSRAGVRSGERVAIWLPSRVESAIIMLACSRNGYVCCPSLHQSYTSDEIVILLKRIRCRALFAMQGYGSDAKTTSIFEKLDQVPSLAGVFVVGESLLLPAVAVPDERQYPRQEIDRAGLPPVVRNPDKIVYLAFTSGTTGLPKGVMHSDNTLLANGRGMVKDWHHDRNTVLLTLSPLSHHIATVAVEQWLVAGMQLVIHNYAHGKSALQWIRESGATYVMGVPTHAMDILEDMRRHDIEELGAVKSFYMAGAPIPREVAERFLRVGVRPQNVYGMTENGSHQYTLPTDPTDTIVSTCGRAGGGYEVRIFNPENIDEELPVGQVGEIGGRGGLLMLGYFDDQTATEKSFNSDGWFMSGDLGIVDHQGCLQIVGRQKDLIIRGGHNIHPARIEDLTHRHAGVSKAAAFAIADDRLGERVCLAIIARPGFRVEPQELLAHLYAVGLSKYDMPEYFIELPKFPLTASGKILKRELMEMAKRGEIKPDAVRWKLE